jgi:antitoxin component YwqK of YwqJK toxin-antitoxin module
MKLKFYITLLLFNSLLSCGNEQISPKKEIAPTNIPKKEQTTKIKPLKNCDSLVVIYYTDGRKKMEGCLYKGKKNGIWREWSFPYGYIDREVITYRYENGIIKTKIDTSWRTGMNQIATIDSSFYYTPDSSYTKYVSFHKNGKLREISPSIKGSAHGTTKIWAENGNLMYEDSTNYGKCVLDKTYNPENNVLVLEEYYGERCEKKLIKEYDKETGILINEKKYKKTVKDDIKYDENGDVISRGLSVKVESFIETQYNKNYNNIITYKKEIKKSFKQYTKAGKLLYEEYYDKNGKVIKKWGVKQSEE